MSVAAPEAPDRTVEEEHQHEVPPEQLALPMIDGRSMDAIEVKIAGTIKLDRSDPSDVALIRKLKLGQEVALKIDAMVVERSGRTALDRDGYFEGASLVTKLNVTSVSRPAGEQLDIDDDPED
jgi:hypothetical protein